MILPEHTLIAVLGAGAVGRHAARPCERTSSGASLLWRPATCLMATGVLHAQPLPLAQSAPERRPPAHCNDQGQLMRAMALDWRWPIERACPEACCQACVLPHLPELPQPSHSACEPNWQCEMDLPVLADLLGRLMVHIGVPSPDQLHSQVVQRLKVVARVRDLRCTTQSVPRSHYTRICI